MYCIEYEQFQGTEECPQYQWKQMALCRKRGPLDKVVARLSPSGKFRVTKLACAAPVNQCEVTACG